MQLALHRAFRHAGVAEDKAQEAAEAIDSALDKCIKESQSHLATKSDVHELKVEIANVRSEMASMKAELIRVFLTSQAATIGVNITALFAALKFFVHG